MAEKGITLYCAGCEPSLTPYRQFFIALCLITGGQYVPLSQANNLTNVSFKLINWSCDNLILLFKGNCRKYKRGDFNGKNDGSSSQ